MVTQEVGVREGISRISEVTFMTSPACGWGSGSLKAAEAVCCWIGRGCGPCWDMGRGSGGRKQSPSLW